MKRNTTIAAALLITALVLAGGFHRQILATPAPVPSHEAGLRVDVWTDRGDGSVYHPGDEVFVYFHASDDCYVTIYDIDTEGRVRMLFPQYPDDGFVYGGMTYRIPDYYDRSVLRATGPRGVEYIHAVATREPRLFRRSVRDRRYDFDFAPVVDDPFVAMNAINARLITPYYIHATATTSFFIEGRVWYPRYMCNSCHHPARIRYFDPYRSVCSRYTVVVAHNYDYWWLHDYHPARTRFVFAGPFWRFEYHTARRHYRHHPHLGCAFGFTNYRPIRPPMRSHVEVERRSPRDVERRTLERSYTRVRYDDVRTRADYGTIRTRDADRTQAPDSRSRDASGHVPTERTRTEGTRTDAVRTDAGRLSTGGYNADVDRSAADRSRTVTVDPGRSSSGGSEANAGRDRSVTTPVTRPAVPNAATDADRVRARSEATTQTGRTRESAVTRAPAQPVQRETATRDGSSIESSRGRDRNASAAPRQENSNAPPRDRSSRAPDQRSR